MPEIPRPPNIIQRISPIHIGIGRPHPEAKPSKPRPRFEAPAPQPVKQEASISFLEKVKTKEGAIEVLKDTGKKGEDGKNTEWSKGLVAVAEQKPLPREEQADVRGRAFKAQKALEPAEPGNPSSVTEQQQNKTMLDSLRTYIGQGAEQLTPEQLNYLAGEVMSVITDPKGEFAWSLVDLNAPQMKEFAVEVFIKNDEVRAAVMKNFSAATENLPEASTPAEKPNLKQKERGLEDAEAERDHWKRLKDSNDKQLQDFNDGTDKNPVGAKYTVLQDLRLRDGANQARGQDLQRQLDTLRTDQRRIRSSDNYKANDPRDVAVDKDIREIQEQIDTIRLEASKLQSLEQEMRTANENSLTYGQNFRNADRTAQDLREEIKIADVQPEQPAQDKIAAEEDRLNLQRDLRDVVKKSIREFIPEKAEKYAKQRAVEDVAEAQQRLEATVRFVHGDLDARLANDSVREELYEAFRMGGGSLQAVRDILTASGAPRNQNERAYQDLFIDSPINRINRQAIEIKIVDEILHAQEAKGGGIPAEDQRDFADNKLFQIYAEARHKSDAKVRQSFQEAGVNADPEVNQNAFIEDVKEAIDKQAKDKEDRSVVSVLAKGTLTFMALGSAIPKDQESSNLPPSV